MGKLPKKKGKRKGRKGTPAATALKRIAKPATPEAPAQVRRRTVLEAMHMRGLITDRMLWAGQRFAKGWRAVNELGSSASGRGFDPWAPRSGNGNGAQLAHVVAMVGEAEDYRRACLLMDRADRATVDRHGQRRRPETAGTMRRIVEGVACEDLSCGELDARAKKAKGWASERLKEGLRVYLDEFGKLFPREVPRYLRQAAS